MLLVNLCLVKTFSFILLAVRRCRCFVVYFIFIWFGSLRGCCAQDVNRSSAPVGVATPIPPSFPLQ